MKSSEITTLEPKKNILIKGAQIHNLKNLDVVIPRNELVVITGLSGSGKSSLAFDTIYAEGQRRYVESLSAYARQFLERMEKPDVDVIQGMSPAIAIEQKTNTRNPRSTVGTTTEIYDYLRLLFARIGKTYCRVCGKLVTKDTVQSVVDTINKEDDGTKFYISFPLQKHEGHSLTEELDALKKRGFFRIIVNGEIIDLNEQNFSPKQKQQFDILVDRFILRKNETASQNRLADSIQTAFVEGNGYAVIHNLTTQKNIPFNQHFECSEDNIRYEEPEPQLFSFNSPIGACPKCQGFGKSVGIDMDVVVPDKTKTLRDGAIHPWTTPGFQEELRSLARIAYDAKIPMNVPFNQLTKQQLDIVMNGYGKEYDGINKFFKWVESKSYKIQYRVMLSRYRGYSLCDECEGTRLRRDALNVKISNKHIGEIVSMTIDDAQKFFQSLSFTEYELSIGKRVIEEIQKRLRYLVDVGVGYLTLDRLSNTLSGGESQRINLATSIGSSLVGSIYVLDEPSIGLHPVDNGRLINILKSLRDIGNTVLVVEHDAEMMREADMLIDIGPYAGEHGGEITFTGTYQESLQDKNSLTGKYLSGKLSIPLPKSRRKITEKKLQIFNAFQHNLKNIDVEIPLGVFVCVTGVSGSGKSTLIHDIIAKGIQKRLSGYKERIPGVHHIDGVENIQHIEIVDQSPIGRTSRSNPATYTKAFDHIREIFSKTPTAKSHGYSAGYFSFNIPGGRCETCEGEGVQTVEMQFMADLSLPCESCQGKRYKREVLDIRYQGKNIDDVLAMTVTEAIQFFEKSPTGKHVAKRLRVMGDVGLGYMRLGQPAPTFSGGEAQRVKLATHLAEKREGHTLFIFDEPTTGLHFDDITKLLLCFTSLLDAGNSVVVIEHNLDVIKCADYIIDIGPGGGEFGGKIVATGTPEELSKNKNSVTGKFLKEIK